MLADVRERWANGAKYKARVEEVTGTLLVPGDTVLDDDARDSMKGDGGRDLFLAKLSGGGQDRVRDLKRNETLLELP